MKKSHDSTWWRNQIDASASVMTEGRVAQHFGYEGGELCYKPDKGYHSQWWSLPPQSPEAADRDSEPPWPCCSCQILCPTSPVHPERPATWKTRFVYSISLISENPLTVKDSFSLKMVVWIILLCNKWVKNRIFISGKIITRSRKNPSLHIWN